MRAASQRPDDQEPTFRALWGEREDDAGAVVTTKRKMK